MYQKLSCSRRAIAPVIATLVIIAITFVGGTITFVFAQELLNTSQISGYPKIEFFQLHGFDARDSIQLKTHIGNNLSTDMSGPFVNDGRKGKEERIVAYVQNMGLKDIVIKDIRLGGVEYSYWPSSTWFVPGNYYSILVDISPVENLSQQTIPIIPAGREVVIVFALEDYTKLERNLQLKITTTNGNIVVDTLRTGRNEGS